MSARSAPPRPHRAADETAAGGAATPGGLRPPGIAVVIATCGRPELLARCVGALLSQTLPGTAYEIVIVDDGRSEATREVVQGLAARANGCPVLRYLRPERDTRGPAAARNCGWRATSAPLVAFTDDDTVPDTHWLREGMRAMAVAQRTAVSGRIVVPVEGRPTDHARVTQGLERAEFVTANAFVRRDALERVGGFDERFTRPWREDSDLYFSLLALGGSVGWAPHALVVHPVREAPWGISLRQQKNVSFDALLFRKHPQLYRQKIRRHPPWRYLAIVGLTGAALVALGLGHPAVAAGCAGGAGLGIAAFAMQRLRGTSHAPSHVAEMLVTSVAIPYLAVYWRVVGALRFRTLFP